MTLADLQARFADALLNGHDEAIVGVLQDGSILRPALLDIYRGSIFASLTAALARTFPQAHLAMGEAAFQQTAHAFIRACPPTTPCLRDYGERFPAFLASARPSGASLSGLARLDWKAHAESDDTRS